MILPTKSLKPIESLYCISAFAVELLSSKIGLDFDVLLDEINLNYPIHVSVEKLQYCLDFLFIIGKLELEDETLKIILK